jgi:hypothetical protein
MSVMLTTPFTQQGRELTQWRHLYTSRQIAFLLSTDDSALSLLV